MELITLLYLISGFGLALCIFVLMPWICGSVLLKWVDLVSGSIPDLTLPPWIKSVLAVRRLLVVVIAAIFIVMLSSYAYRAELGALAGIREIVINPMWIVICLSGLWLARNVSDGSSTMKSVAVAVGFGGLCLLIGWLTLLPLSFIEKFISPFFWLSPLNLIFGVILLRTQTDAPPNGHRLIKYIFLDVAIAYTVALIFLVFASGMSFIFPD